ncbi:MAG: RES family NAD+ phosphorylase [Mangrovibacterium sp.]
MRVYRIVSHIWGDSLQASGLGARWNSGKVYVIYSAESRSLATLENIAHRKRNGLKAKFTLQVIEIPDDVNVEVLDESTLPADWNLADEKTYEKCRVIGDSWASQNRSAVLQVPSAMIKEEKNYLLNPNHPDFKLIQLVNKEDYRFDSRLSDPSLTA